MGNCPTAFMIACGDWNTPDPIPSFPQNTQDTLRLVEAMLQRGAHVNAHEKNGLTPLMYAALFNHPDTVRLLLAHAAEVNATSKTGVTPLMCATDIPRPTLVSLLLAHEAEVNRQDKDGNTALLLAVKPFMPPTLSADDPVTNVVKQLLSHGANPNLANNRGETPLKYAQDAERSRRADLVALLKQYGARK